MKTLVKMCGVCLVLCAVTVMLGGCTLAFKKSTPSDTASPVTAPAAPVVDMPTEEIQQLSSEVARLQQQLEMLNKLKAREAKEMTDTKKLLEKRLRKEIGQNQVKVEMGERGLVITFLAEVLFDSGKDVIRSEAFDALDKVARILREDVAERDIAVEGYTDNVPIKYSGWKSNWELSTARATSVLHYLIDEGSIEPTRLQATGYGEYRPVMSNDSPEGRQQNRRVEVVILPQSDVTKVPYGTKATAAPSTSTK